MNTRDEYVRKLQEKIGEWNAEIDALAARGAEVKAEARDEYAEQIQALKAKQAAAREKLEELQHSGENAWEDLKTGAELAWSSMVEAITSAKSRFK